MALHMRSSLLFNIICFGEAKNIGSIVQRKVIKTLCCFWSLFVLASNCDWYFSLIPTFAWLIDNFLVQVFHPYIPLTIDKEHLSVTTQICNRMFATNITGLFKIFLEIHIHLIGGIPVSLYQMETILDSLRQSGLANLVFETESKCYRINGATFREQELKIISIKTIFPPSDCPYDMDLKEIVGKQINRLVKSCSKNKAKILESVFGKRGRGIGDLIHDNGRDRCSFEIVLYSPAGEIRLVMFKYETVQNQPIKSFLLERLPVHKDVFKLWLMLIQYSLFYWGSSDDLDVMAGVFKRLDRNQFGLFNRLHIDMRSNLNTALFKQRVNGGDGIDWPLPLRLDLCNIIRSIMDGVYRYEEIPDSWKNALFQNGVDIFRIKPFIS